MFKKRRFRSSIASTLQIVGMLLFAFGYFAVDEKIARNEFITDDYLSFHTKTIEDHCDLRTSNANFDKLVFIVIDALRADFIPSVVGGHFEDAERFTMPFTESLIAQRKAIALISEAQTPTVTMPRIKALLSGTQPNFLDLIFNLNAAKFGDDNFVEQAYRKRKRIIFYGDDTWLKMFPSGMFLRWHVTHSFFATDYTTVDTNVTEKMILELTKLRNWDYLILHYLGVDHIGHAHGGAKSPLLRPKLIEMDDVVKRIYEAVKSTDVSYLIVITGDHGMTNAGNHGGSTGEEVDTAMIFVDVNAGKSHYVKNNIGTRMKQIDLAVTLSTLLGLPIPSKSRGKLVTSVIDTFETNNERKLCFLYRNALQLLKAAVSVDSSVKRVFNDAVSSHKLFLNNNSIKESSFSDVKRLYEQCVNVAQSSFAAHSSHTICWPIFFGFTFGISAVICLVTCTRELHNRNSFIFRDNLTNLVTLFALFSLFGNIILLTATSYIEMEIHYWSYITMSVVVINCVIELRELIHRHKNHVGLNDLHLNYLRFAANIVLTLMIRLGNSWNAMDSNISDWLMLRRNQHLLSASVIFSMICLAFSMSVKYSGKQKVVFLSGLFWIYLYRSDLGLLLPNAFQKWNFVGLSSISAVYKARIVYFHTVIIFLVPLVKWWNPFRFISDVKTTRDTQNFTSLLCAWILLCGLLSKVQNIPFILLHVLTEKLLNYCLFRSDKVHKTTTLILVYSAFAMSAFYNSGNSNSISTIDVAAGYTGLTDYNLLIVAILVIVNTYSMFIFWYLMMFMRMNETTINLSVTHKADVYLSVVNVLLLIRFLTVNFYEIVAISLQNHLFIWTVICPKFLYEAFLTMLTIVLLHSPLLLQFAVFSPK